MARPATGFVCPVPPVTVGCSNTDTVQTPPRRRFDLVSTQPSRPSAAGSAVDPSHAGPVDDRPASSSHIGHGVDASGELAVPALIADIGGTNARFALTDTASGTVAIRAALSLRNADFASLQHAAEHFLSTVQVQPQRAAIAVASPVAADAVRLTNRAWSFSRIELQAALGLSELRLLNDFGAVARAVPALGPEDSVHLYGPELPMPFAEGPVTVLGPGTGLGVAVLVGSASERWHVVETEGGHTTFAPIGDEEQRIARWLGARYGRASTERVLSGIGLSHIDAVLRGAEIAPVGSQAPDLREPAGIVAAALDGHDLPARQALARFCAVLGSVAGDAALIHGARSVMIAGGIVPRFIPFLRSSAFRERFLAKGRFSAYLESVSIRVICHPHPGLLGAAVALREPGRPLSPTTT